MSKILIFVVFYESLTDGPTDRRKDPVIEIASVEVDEAAVRRRNSQIKRGMSLKGNKRLEGSKEIDRDNGYHFRLYLSPASWLASWKMGSKSRQ